MSRPPPPDEERPGLKGKPPLNADALFPENPNIGEFRGPNVDKIKKCCDMPMISWEDYVNQDSFPEFNDGYNAELFYDEDDKNALLEQSQYVLESEIYDRDQRRKKLLSNYNECKQKWIQIHQQPENAPASDTIEDGHGGKYVVTKLLGQGQFGVVYAANKITSPLTPKPTFAIKVARPEIRYRQQAYYEVQKLQYLQQNATEEEMKYIIKFYDWFIYRDRLCIVNELLSFNLYEVLKKRGHKGLPLVLVQSVMKQLCHALVTLEKCTIIHSDIKPENVLLVGVHSTDVKLVDFGSSHYITQPCSKYIQSRYYRAPEVVLGLDYDYKIDVWSVACVGFELFLALPLFPGQNEIHLLELIVQMLGPIPEEVVDKSYRKDLFLPDKTLKSEEQICREQGTEVVRFNHYFTIMDLSYIVLGYEIGFGHTQAEQAKERKRRLLFIDLLKKMLNLSPDKRYTARECLQHPFLTTDLNNITVD